MLQVSDVRQTRVFQEALEEGIQKSREEGKQEGREEGKQEGREEGKQEVAARLLQSGHSVDDIAKLTGLPLSQIRKLKNKKSNGSQRSKK